MTNKKIEFAPAFRVESLRPQVDALLRELAWLFKEPEESAGEWLRYVFVSDESRLADFLSSDEELDELRLRLALPQVQMRNFICDVAILFDRSKQPPIMQ